MPIQSVKIIQHVDGGRTGRCVCPGLPIPVHALAVRECRTPEAARRVVAAHVRAQVQAGAEAARVRALHIWVKVDRRVH